MKIIAKFIFLLSSFVCFSSFASGNALKKCQSCHIPYEGAVNFTMQDKGTFFNEKIDDMKCVHCHLNLNFSAQKKIKPRWLPFSKKNIEYFSNNPLYFLAPPLMERITLPTGNIKKYTKNGLISFLKNPVPRYYNANTSMFPMTKLVIKEVVESWSKNLAIVPEFILEKERFKKGEELYMNQCLSCHGPDNDFSFVPKLRIGIPLLSFKYFSWRVKNGSGSKYFPHHGPYWSKNGRFIKRNFNERPSKIIMPAHQDLSSEDMKNVFSYISNDRSDLISKKRNKKKYSLKFGMGLFREVEKIFNTSCKHCHSSRESTQKVIKSIFGTENVKKSSVVSFPDTLRWKKEKVWDRIFQTGEGCIDAPLVKRLKNRHSEWAGKKRSQLRGMPLTLRPLPMNRIQLVELWTKTGCPSPKGNLCSPCK